MITYQNCEIYASVVIYVVSKLLCIFSVMYDKRALTSIPETNENVEEKSTTKWVPKKKHEVLKAKYKCLKKLFQIYDASVIGILPDPYGNHGDGYENREDETNRHSRRKKRSHLTKTDDGPGTTEVSSGDVTLQSEGKPSTITTVIRDLNIQRSCSTQMLNEVENSRDSSIRSRTRECEETQTSDNLQPAIPYLVLSEKRKLTRFQVFVQRIFGISSERCYKKCVLDGHVYASSDNNIVDRCGGRRRRRGLRFRRLRKPKRTHSDGALPSGVILSYVHSAQRSCLADTTPRHCPVVGCQMIFNGIINYNDHLNICHFTDRKYICHYCHEGFAREHDKHVHEHEHLGITKLNNANFSTSTVQKASDTQTDPELNHDKLKKIVSFFDKIDNDKLLREIGKSRCSESNLQTEIGSATESGSVNSSDKRTVSCGNLLHRKENKMAANSDVTSFPSQTCRCQVCGESFDFRRQLSLHVDLEHRTYDKYSKFHSCAGITHARDAASGGKRVQATRHNLTRIATSSTLQETCSEISRRKSEESLSCDPSTNIIYYESLESVKTPSTINDVVRKVKSGGNCYKWEPGTKIIRV